MHTVSVEMADNAEMEEVRLSLGLGKDEQRCKRIVEIAESYEVAEGEDPIVAMRRLAAVARRHDKNVKEVLKLTEPRREAAAKREGAMAVVLRADRVLPGTWKENVGVSGNAPDWRQIAEESQRPPRERGHWIRGTFEFRAPRDSRVRIHLVELEIADLPGLLEEFGMEVEIWMVKTSTREGPIWVLPTELDGLAVRV